MHCCGGYLAYFHFLFFLNFYQINYCTSSHYSINLLFHYHNIILFYLQGGDSIPADSIVVSNTTIASSESALTGEPEDLKKSKNKDCFLLSSCLITEGEGCRALVIGIGPHSQWGKIKANLVTESVNTPLQDKLQHMTTNVSTDMCTYGLVSFCFYIQQPSCRND